jgi:hypothetical protein
MAQDAASTWTQQRLDEFAAGLAKLKDKPDEAKKYVAEEAVKDKGLELHEMTEPKDKYSLYDDPVIKPLKDNLNLRPPGPDDEQRKPEEMRKLEELLMRGSGTYAPTRFSSITGAFEDEKAKLDFGMTAGDAWKIPFGERFVFWRAKDEPARTPRFAEARPRVIEAWRTREAQDLADKKAREVADAVSQGLQKSGVAENTPAYLEHARKLFAEQQLGTPFELTGVAQLKPRPVANAGMERKFDAYKLPPDTVPMPPPSLVDRLLELDAGKALVFKDVPKKKYYVAVAVRRAEPSREECAAVFADATEPGKNDMWQIYFLPEFHKEFRNKLMRQLREDASPGNVDNDGKLKFTSRDNTEESQ